MTDWTDTVKFILPFIPGVGIQNNIRLQYSTVLLRKKKGRRCVATKMQSPDLPPKSSDFQLWRSLGEVTVTRVYFFSMSRRRRRISSLSY